MKIMQLAALAGIVSFIQVLLIVSGMLQPMSNSTPENMLFSAARLVIVAYAGFSLAAAGLKKAAICGAEVALVSNGVIAVCALAGYFIGMPILGISVPGIGALILSLAILIFANSAIGAALAAAVALIARPRK
jgi:hypothetical protein